MTEAEVFHKIQLIEAAIEELRAAARPVNPVPKRVDFPTAIKALVCDGKSIYLLRVGPVFRIDAPLASNTLCSFSGSDMMSKNWVIIQEETQ
jgi:hypothetical protein